MEMRHMSKVVLHNKKTDYVEDLTGGMKCFQVLTVISGYCCEILIAWSVLSHGIMVPGNTPIYCSTTNHTIHDVMTQDELKVLRDEACSPGCPELYCNGREAFTAATQFLTMLGVFCGNFGFGLLGAKYGRKLPTVLGVICIAVMGVCTAFSPNIWVYLICKIIWNIFIGGIMTNSFILYSEIVGVKWRPTVGLLAQIPFALGHLTLALFAYLHSDWRWFTLTITLPSILLIHYIWTMPESPQWLISVGKVEKAIKVMEFIARRNKMPTDMIRQRIMFELEKEKEKPGAELEHREGKMKDMFDGCIPTFITLGCWINWFAVFCSYFGVAQLCGSLGSNLYVSFALSALTQQPSVLFAFYSLNYWGRKWSLVVSNGLATISLICIICVPSETYKIIPAVVGMFALGMSYPGVFVYTVELFPTPTRTIGMGSSSAIGSVGAMLAAVVVDLNKIKGWLPPMILASLSFMAFMTVLFMPETKGQPLPKTKDDLIRTMQKDKLNMFNKRRFKNLRRRSTRSTVTADSLVESSLSLADKKRAASQSAAKGDKKKEIRSGSISSTRTLEHK